jgi:hypothetical protein
LNLLKMLGVGVKSFKAVENPVIAILNDLHL